MKKKKVFIILVVLIGLILAYFFFIRKDASAPGSGSADKHKDTIANSAPVCGITKDMKSPSFYVSDTKPAKNGNLNSGKLEGDPIKIVGYVYGSPEKSKPLANAKIEVWQADSFGTYHPASTGSASKYTAAELALRSYVSSDKYGYYEFSSIYPGASENRARHIYIKVSAEGYQPVTTQLVMSSSGDVTSVANDPTAQNLPICNRAFFSSIDGVQTAAFIINLAAANTSTANN